MVSKMYVNTERTFETECLVKLKPKMKFKMYVKRMLNSAESAVPVGQWIAYVL